MAGKSEQRFPVSREEGPGLVLEAAFCRAGAIRLLENPRAVTDDPVPRPGGVAGIAHVDGSGREPFLPGHGQQTLDGVAAAGLMVLQGQRVKRLDGRAGPAVGLFRLVVGQIVAQVRTDEDQRFRPAPQNLQHLGHLFGGRMTDDHRHDVELAEEGLQEGQVHFEAVIVLVGGVEHLNERQVADLPDRIGVDGNFAERRRERVRFGQRYTVHGDPVARAHHHHAFDPVGPRDKAGIGAGGGKPRINVAGMGRDDGLGHRAVRLAVRLAAPGRFGKVVPDRGFQLPGVARIKHPGDGGRADRIHLPYLSTPPASLAPPGSWRKLGRLEAMPLPGAPARFFPVSPAYPHG